MFHQTKSPLLAATLFVVTLSYSATGSADSPAETTYEIVKATDTRVWRLNQRTGEIAVCSMEGELLLCTSSSQAITPAPKTYAELEAERDAQARLDNQRREDSRERKLAMLNLMMNTFKQLAITGSEFEAPN